MKEIDLGKNKKIGLNEPVFVTLDVGKNFIDTLEVESPERLLEKAKKLVLAAKECGADAVKFQTHIVDDEQRQIPIISPHFNKDRYEWLKRNTFSKEWWRELKRYADEKGIIFYSTPMSIAAADLLEEIGVGLFKIGSADITDLMLIEHVAKKGKPMIISSGMTTKEELKTAVYSALRYNPNVMIMHCISEYPCLPEKLNLNVIKSLHEEFRDLPIGLSDHVLEYETTYAAVALGAVAIEKHFTFDRNAFGPDHKVSLTPVEVAEMVKKIKVIKSSLGSDERELTENELAFRKVFRKSLVAGRDIQKGEIITREMICAKRPAGGIYTSDLWKVAGKKANMPIKKDSLIEFGLLE